MIIKENIILLENLIKTNLLPLAFIGDGVHTLFVREFVAKKINDKMGNYHNHAAYFCKANTQANMLKKLMPFLDEDELDIVRRGRNVKAKHHAKNASSSDYSYATAFEILIGYLYLKGNQNRFDEILNLSIQLINQN